MKRRDFLKILGIAPAVAVIPALAKTNESIGFLKIGGHEIAEVVDFSFETDNYYTKEQVRQLIDGINEELPGHINCRCTVIPLFD